MSEILVDRLYPMAPVSLHEISNKLSLFGQQFENLKEYQEEKWKNCGDRQDRIDAHLKATDTRVDELRTFMIQVKAIGIAVGIIWPLVVKYVLPK